MALSYYDPDRDNPVDGLIFTSELAVLLSDLTRRDDSTDSLTLTPEGSSGLSKLMNMAYQASRDMARQLHEGHLWQTAAALTAYLRAYAEAEEGLRAFLVQARAWGFTGWGEIPLDWRGCSVAKSSSVNLLR